MATGTRTIAAKKTENPVRLFARWARRLVPYPFKSVLCKPVVERKNGLRKDVVKLRLEDHVFLELYWKEVELGKGPSVILNIKTYETIRFDLFGEPGGHFHVQSTQWMRASEQRLWLAEETRHGQIDRALFELQHNTPWYLDRHPVRRVRNTPIDPSQWVDQIDKARAILYSYADKFVDSTLLTSASGQR